jgi:anti-sigma factor ChrR (cupin superfamily)
MTREEKAQGYVLGSLSPLERDEVARARLSDPALDAAIAELERGLAPLTALAGTRPPSAGLFDRVAAAIRQERAELAGKAVERCADGDWQPYAPGIEWKPLWSSDTCMLRCQPGAVLAPHDHARHEHLLVLSGDLSIGGRTLSTGDYHLAPAGTGHGAIGTRTGCLLLVQYGDPAEPVAIDAG